MAGTGTLTVTPDTGSSTVTINTLPPSGQATPTNSLPATLDTTVQTAPGTPGTAALTVQGSAAGVPLVVGGAVAPGQAPTANPVGVSGVDGGGLKRALLTDTTGALAVAAGENHVGEIGGNSAVVVATLTRPANTTAYAAGQAVQSSPAAATPLPVARKNGGTGRLTRLRLSKTGTSLTNAAFLVHIFKNAPVTLPADGAAFTPSGTLDYVGAFPVTMNRAFTDGAKGIGTPEVGPYITFDTVAGTTTLFALIQANGPYTPTSSEMFTLAVETDRD